MMNENQEIMNWYKGLCEEEKDKVLAELFSHAKKSGHYFFLNEEDAKLIAEDQDDDNKDFKNFIGLHHEGSGEPILKKQ